MSVLFKVSFGFCILNRQTWTVLNNIYWIVITSRMTSTFQQSSGFYFEWHIFQVILSSMCISWGGWSIPSNGLTNGIAPGVVSGYEMTWLLSTCLFFDLAKISADNNGESRIPPWWLLWSWWFHQQKYDKGERSCLSCKWKVYVLLQSSISLTFQIPQRSKKLSKCCCFINVLKSV